MSLHIGYKCKCQQNLTIGKISFCFWSNRRDFPGEMARAKERGSTHGRV